MIKEGKELNDVVCTAYRMGCEQTREVYQKRIEKLEAALRKYADEEYNGYNADGAHARKALEDNMLAPTAVLDALETKD